MKKYPYPDKKLKSEKEIREYLVKVIDNLMLHLKIDGYDYHIFFPTNDGWVQHDEAGFCITVKYPYRNFEISIQHNTLEKINNQKLDAPFWQNLEESLVHELCHVITWRLVELAKMRYVTPTDIDNEDENVVDYFANIISTFLRNYRKNEK